MSVDNSVSDITITAVPEVSTSTVTITNTVDSTTSSGTGTFNLVSGTNTFNIDVQSEDTTTKTYTLTVTKAASSNTYLSSISVDNGTLDPTFNKNTKEYTVDLTNETSAITITAVPEDSTSTVTGDGLKSLNVGANRFEIEVAAEDGVSTDTYVVTVNRAASSVNKLSDLTVDGTTITGFSSDNNNYSLNVPNDKTSVEIGATVLDPTSTVSGLGTKTLSTGPNVITIPVTAEDGSVNNYIITITRAKNSNNYLKKLDVDEGTITPEFNKDTETYNITVPNEITNLTIDAEPEVTTSSVAIEDNHDFAVGDNTVKINVTAEDDSVRTYKIVVNRQVYADNFLSTLTVTDASDNSYDLNPDFKKNTLSYEVGIPSTITSVDVNATATASDSTITGTGTVPITSLPQTQKVVVRSGSGIERTYKINFVRGLSNNNKLLSLSVNPGTLSPAFNKNTNTYNVSLPSSATSITISATADSSIQSMTGTGTFSLSSGTNTFNVIVTAENGSINTYTINVNVGVTSSNKLTSLTVSEGTLDPAFDPDTRLYNVNVGSTISTIDIDATGPNTITGLGTKNLDEGNNIFEVKSIDSDGNENVYRVVVNKSYATPPAISDPDLAYLAVDGYTISPEFTSANTEYSATIAGESRVDVIAVPKDPSNTVTISGNDDLNNNNTITVTVTNTGGVSKTYTISTSSFMDKLKSDVYTLDTYVNRVPINKNVGDFKNEFLNPNEYLKVYDADGTLLSDSELIGTGYTIKLEKDGTVYDSKIIIVLTDLNGDAEVSVADIILIRQYILETGTLSVTAEKAAYVNDDEDIDIADLLLIKKAILEGGE